jgi:hypothetical protein
MGLIPLGILSSAGGGFGTYELIETQILGSAAASVTFSGLATYLNSYKHLQIRLTSRSSSADTDDNLLLQINGVTSGYSQHGLWASGSSVTGEGTASTSSIFIARTTAANAPASAFSVAVIDLLDAFSSSKNKTFRGFSGTMRASAPFVDFRSGLRQSVDSTTSILIKAQNGNLVTGSRFSLYGIR